MFFPSRFGEGLSNSDIVQHLNSAAFDATDAEHARRAHDYEMGAVSAEDQRWTRFYNEARRAVVANGWETSNTLGLDGADDEDGFSIDGAYEAFEARKTVAAYLLEVARNRRALGLGGAA